MDYENEEYQQSLEKEWGDTQGKEGGGDFDALPKGKYPCKLENCRIDLKNESTGKEYDDPRYQISFRVAGGEFKGRYVNFNGPIMQGDAIKILKNALANMRVSVPRLTLDDGVVGSGLVDAITQAAEAGKCHVWIAVKPNENYPNNPRTYINKHLTDEEIDQLDAAPGAAPSTAGASEAGEVKPF